MMKLALWRKPRSDNTLRAAFKMANQKAKPVWMNIARASLHTTPQDSNKRDPKDKMHQVLTIPNAITMTRIAFTPYLGHLILQGDYKVAIGVLTVAAASDWLDGFLARRFDQKTIVGTFLDPLADKFMIGTLCVSLGYVQLIPLPLVVLMFGRDLLLIGGTLLYRHQTKSEKSSFFEANDTFEVEPSRTSKLNTLIQFQALGGALLYGAFPIPELEIPLNLLFLGASMTTLASGFGYLTAWRNREGMFRHLPK